jgi:hypothetical protein
MKVKINKLPKGFALVNGKVVKKAMSGGRTGQQDSSYGLVTDDLMYDDITNTYTKPFGNVSNTLQPIPRDQANLEAEKGETALTDMNNDGDFELYNIGGKRHSEGGTPLNLPPQSFIFSDTSSMKLNPSELAEMGIDSKKKITPADVSKKFQLNKYISILDDEHADKISKNTAEYMLQKNKEYLSQLSFLQEAKKEFDDGVPLASYPYLQKQGVNPIQFSQEVENITKEQAELKAMMQLPVEVREKVMELKAQTQEIQRNIKKEEENKVINNPEKLASRQLETDMLNPDANTKPIAPLRDGGSLQKYQTAGGFPMQNPNNYLYAPVDNTSTAGYGFADFNPSSYKTAVNSQNGNPNDIFSSALNTTNNNEEIVENQGQISKLTDFNEELKRLNAEIAKLANQERELLLQTNAVNSKNQQANIDAASVEYWVKHIESGYPPPSEPNQAYLEAYKQVYQNKIDNVIKNENDQLDNAVDNQETYIKNNNEEMLKNLFDQIGQQKEDPYKPNNDIKLQQQSDLNFTDKSSPYYVGAAFAAGDTLETMDEGGELPKAADGDELNESLNRNAFPIELKVNGEPVTINNSIELARLKTTDPDTYNLILRAYEQNYNEVERKSVNVDERDIQTIQNNYEGYDSWSSWYMDPAQKAYRNKRYEVYKTYVEDQKANNSRFMQKNPNFEVLSEEDFHRMYSHHNNVAYTLNEKAKENPLYRDDPNWDSEYRWIQDDTCSEEDIRAKRCKNYRGNVWRNTGERLGKNWYYNQEYEKLGLVDANGNPIPAWNETEGAHMQAAINSGAILSKLPNQDITINTKQNIDTDQLDSDANASKMSTYIGNDTLFNPESAVSETTDCANAAEIKAQCDQQGGTFVPYDVTTGEGCTCVGGLEEIDVPDIDTFTPPDPQFWLQDKMGLANALDAKMSLKKYYPWAPKYNENLLDPVFKDPEREIAAIGEQAVIAADTASAFSGPQRAAAVQAKAQGKAAAQIADAVNRVQSDNVTIANTVEAKNAEIKYKTQLLNNNELKKLYDNTVLTEQNYDNSLRKANAEITKQMQNMYTNAANTYNMNTLYPNFNVMPGSGGFIDIVDYNKFNQDPNYVSPGDATSQYAEFYRNMVLTGVPESNIPTFNQWNNNFNPSGGGGGSDADGVNNSGYPGGVVRNGREVRLARSGMALNDFLKRTRR